MHFWRKYRYLSFFAEASSWSHSNLLLVTKDPGLRSQEERDWRLLRKCYRA